MTLKKRLERFRRLLEAEGIDLLDVSRTSGSHIRLLLEFCGDQRIAIISSTPGDRRVDLNNLTMVRRLFKMPAQSRGVHAA